VDVEWEEAWRGALLWSIGTIGVTGGEVVLQPMTAFT
jgi:hypothetical protein